MNKPKQLWIYLRSSFWFTPSLIVASSVALAVGLIEADTAIDSETLARWPRLFGAGAEGARQMLSTIAGSMMSVVGITFSMTLVALALASSQYTSRVLGNFMRSRVTQVVLGIFAGIFTYCLIVLRTIRGSDEVMFVPSLAVLVGVVLALAGVGILILFIHHIATSIQASSIISSIADETIAAIDQVFPDRSSHPSDEADEVQPPHASTESRNWHIVAAAESGYIQGVDYKALLGLARERNTVIRMNRGIGEFVVKNAALASLPLEDQPDEETVGALHSFYSISNRRTIEQDPAFGIRQIVDVALKALSPGINDTTTAVTCVDYLTVILACLALRHFPSQNHYEEGELRLITIGPTFAALLAESFDEIRGSAKGNVSVMAHMLGALETIVPLTADDRRRETLRKQARWIAELAHRSLDSAHDRAAIDIRLASLSATLEEKPREGNISSPPPEQCADNVKEAR